MRNRIMFGTSPTNLSSVPQDLDILPIEDGIIPKSIQAIRVLGQGRAAEARLVDVSTDDGYSIRCVEKVFCPGLLTRSIYRACFQSAFAYQFNGHAIRACFYRRRVAWAICRALLPDVGVARPLYVRWDRQSQAMVLASEFVHGRGIQPQQLDTYMLRRYLAQRLAGYFSRIAHAFPQLHRWLKVKIPEPPAEEIEELLTVMKRLESLFLDSGLVGTGWQVCKQAIVSTANLLRTQDGYFCIDLESGIPSVLVPTYLSAGLRLRSFPLFDCLDSQRLRQWLHYNQPRLAASLSNGQLLRLDKDVELLIEHTQKWKGSEPALLRNPLKLATSGFYRQYKQRIIEQWERCGIVDEAALYNIQSSSRPLGTRLIYWLGWIPGRPGKFLQKLVGDCKTRHQVVRFFREAEFRQQIVGEFVAKQKHYLHHTRRVPTSKLESISVLGLLLQWGLSKITSAKVQRLLSDSTYRANWLLRLVLIFSSGRFQQEYSRWVIQQRFQAWQNEHRLSSEERLHLSSELERPALQEYLKGFGVHLGLKLLLPILLPFKAFGVAASLASGNPIFFISTLFLLPMLRTVATVWRIFRSGRPAGEFRNALIVGALPTIGTLAFPVQMVSTCPRLSVFLMRDFASRLGRIVPIYGGKDSRTEIAAIKSVNLIAESLDLWLQLTASRNKEFAESREVEQATQPSRWDSVAIAQLKLIDAEYVNQTREQPHAFSMGFNSQSSNSVADNRSKAA